jgi:RNA-directed DNA polymerase
VALSVLDEYVAQAPGGPGASRNDRLTRRRHGLPNYRLSRYADDWCLVVSGTKADAEALREEIAGVLSTMGLRLSEEKTLITHIDEGLDFLGWHIQRRRKRGTSRRYVYTYPSHKAVKAVTGKVKTRCRQNLSLPLETLLRQLNPVLRGWTAYFRPGVSSIAFGYLRAFTWRQVVRWLRRKHRGITWKELRRRFCVNRWWPADGDVIMFNPGAVRTTRYRYRGTKIPSPWPSARMRTTPPTHRDLWRAGCADEAHVRFGKRAGETHRWKHRQGAPVRPHHVNIRLEEHKLCLLVMIGVRADGRKELVALSDGYREAT